MSDYLSSVLSVFIRSQSKQSSSYSDRDTTEDDSESLEDMDFLSRQKKLQAEAKLALAMAKPMAKMQVEVEKQNRKKSPVADLVSDPLSHITFHTSRALVDKVCPFNHSSVQTGT